MHDSLPDVSAEPLVRLRGITKRFPGVIALEEVGFDISQGELLAIVGENGAGKSTLMKILSGVIPDYEGELFLRGKPVRFSSTREAENAGIRIIHQELNLVEQLSAAGNIFLGREPRRGLWRDDQTMRQRAAELLAELECRVSPDQPVGTLRVGDQQLVEIAKALSQECDLLIMDEPTSALTESETARLFRVIQRLRSRGVTILYISHKMDEVFRLSDRIVVLRDGKQASILKTSQTIPSEVTHWMVGREIESTRLGEDRRPGEVVLEVRDLRLAWPGHARQWRLQDIHFSLRRGEILGVAGLMGAGRTELMECLFGAGLFPPEGTILLEGKPVRFSHPEEACRAGIALVTEDRKRLGIFDQMSVGANITLAALNQAVRGGFMQQSRELALAEKMVDDLNVKTAGVQAPITSLSGGNQQKAILGRWLLRAPKVLLLDDPTRGVDVGAKAELYRLMDRLCRQGLGILITSSELPELLTLCDRILVLAEGKMTGEFTRSEANEEKIIEAATRL